MRGLVRKSSLLGIAAAVLFAAPSSWAAAPLITKQTAGFASGTAGPYVTTGTPADTPVGSLAVIVCAARTVATVPSVSDSAGNTYTQIGTAEQGSVNVVQIFASITTADLPTGGTATCPYPSTSGAKGVGIASFSGVGALTPVRSNKSTGTSTASTPITATPLPATGTFPFTSGLALAFVALPAGTAPTESSGFTSVAVNSVSAGFDLSYQVLTSPAALSFAPTMNGTQGGYSLIVAALPAPGAVISSGGCTLATMGVGPC